MSQLQYDAVILGGGFFGCKISCYLKKYFNRIILIEKETDLLQRASYANQARVHNGYHYPRSLLTALRSRVNFPQFVQDYRDCIDDTFDKYYAIGKIFSKVNAHQFKLFCQRIEAPLEPANIEIKKLFNKNLIEEVFWTKEYAFDAVKLKKRVLEELEEFGVEVRFNSQVIKVKENSDSAIEVFFQSDGTDSKVTTRYVFNCTYSSINEILAASGLPTIPLKHEFTEMALVEVPEPIKYLGITLMCGPFFSIMPFPARGLHTLSHVRYTPHCYWQDTENSCEATSENFNKIVRKTNYTHMIRDVARYMPILKDCPQADSLWEVKTVLPQSEVDDSRPILFKRTQALKNLICVLGGKIDNVYDIPQELQFLSHESTYLTVNS
jgi:L-2-hydroxyglutarate oxidase LhgO